MSTYTIQEMQTGLDVCNQLYSDQDHIYDIYIDNDEFDINLMQNGITLDYTDVSNQIINEIVNNDFNFVNRDVVTTTNIIEFECSAGCFNLDLGIVTYDGATASPDMYIKIDNTGDVLSNTNDISNVNLYEPYNTISIETDKISESAIYSVLNFSNLNLTSLTLKDSVRVGYDFTLNITNQQNLIDFDFISKFVWVSVETYDSITINVENSIPNEAAMLSLTAALVSTGMENGVIIYNNNNDYTLSGSDWEILESRGWSNTLVWILSTGYWNDESIWVDLETWID